VVSRFSIIEGEIVEGKRNRKSKVKAEKADLLDWLLAIDASLS
jgi:hypothetical protein